MVSEMRHLDEVIAKFKAMQVDPTEYAYLKGIVLFRTCKLNLYILYLREIICNIFLFFFKTS